MKSGHRSRLAWALIGASLILVPTVWFLVPYVGNRVEVPYLLLVAAANLLCDVLIGILLLKVIKERQRSEAVPWQRILWLDPPTVRTAHRANKWFYLLLILLVPACLVIVMIMGISTTLLCRLPSFFPGQYVCFFDLAAPFFYKNYALAALVLAGWVFMVVVEEIFRVLWVGDPRRTSAGWFFSALLLTLLNFYSPVIGIFRFVLNAIHSSLLSILRSFWLVFTLRCMEVGLVAALLFAGVCKSGLDPLPDRLRFPYLSITNKPVFFALEKPTPRPTRTGVKLGTANRPWEELDGKDLRDFDLSARADYLLTCNFSTLTRWPEGAKMATGFKPDTILDLGMNPGLRVRELHRRGITGAGVGIGIIDNVFYPLHEEYKDNLRWYEEINSFLWKVNPEMHGSAVTSMALGKRCGVAPNADLYYIGLNGILFAGVSVGHSIGYAINRLVSINEKLPTDRRIRVISISIEVGYPCPGYNYFMRAVDRAERNNIHVVFCSLNDRQKWWFLPGIGRQPYDDPDQLAGYSIGGWYNTPYFLGRAATDHFLYVPCDCRTFADHHSPNAYRFFRNGGQSWQAPWIAGLYALCAQVNPKVTPASFYAAFDKTGDCITSQANGITNTFRPVANPIKMVEAKTH